MSKKEKKPYQNKEWRIVPKEWNYLSKVHRYQTEETFKQGQIAFPAETHRHEVRVVFPWVPSDFYDTDDNS